MATSEMEEIKKIRIINDNYEATILGLQAFHKAITWRNGTVIGHHHSLGRRMTPSKNNPIGAEDDVTPDLMVQIGDNLGYVVEAKRSLPRNKEYWQRDIDQIRKYDDELLGWWTVDQHIPNSNLVLLIWTKFLADFTALLEDGIRDGTISFNNPISLVEFSRVLELQEVVFLRRGWGIIDDKEMAHALSTGISIPLELIIASGERILKFYDDPPTTEYLMAILWNNIFNISITELEYDKSLGAWPIEVSVSDIALELQRLYGSEGNGDREQTFPREAWVREALEAFVKLKLAKCLDDEGHYLIKFKTTIRTGESGDLIDWFAKHRLNSSVSNPNIKQMELF